MAKQQQHKTNAQREVEAAGFAASYHGIDVEDGFSFTGTQLAEILGEDPDRVFKTLVTQGKSGEHYVFMIPVACELDLKKAAQAAGEKAITMIKSRELLPLTGYIHGGCSPVGMKKLFPTVFHETAASLPVIMVSAGKLGHQIACDPKALLALVRADTADIITEE